MKDHNNRGTLSFGCLCRFDIYKKNISVNSQLSEKKKLIYKFTVLLALSSALRASSIQHLNNNFMGKTKSCYNFCFNNLHKSWRKGKTPSAVIYQEYTQN